MKRFPAVLFCVLLLGLSASAQTPRRIALQGYLTDDVGDPVDTSVDLTFRLYTTSGGGSALWTESHSSVPVSEGVYGVLLGGGTGDDLADVNFNQTLYLSVQVGADPEMTQRTLLASSPSALTLVVPAVLEADVSSPGGAVLKVTNTATSGQSSAVVARSHSTEGNAVSGFAQATTGSTNGVYGVSSSSSGVGVRGYASSETGSTFGVRGESSSPEGIGVYGQGTAAGVKGQTSDPAGKGVHGVAVSTGENRGVYGQSISPEGIGVYGNNQASTGDAVGVSGESGSESGIGVYGYGAASSDTTYGVVGVSDSRAGIGVAGYGAASPGKTIGVFGQSEAIQGIGVYGVTENTNQEFNTIGVRGIGWVGVKGDGETGIWANGYDLGARIEGARTGLVVRSISNESDILLAGDDGVISTSGPDANMELRSQSDVEIRLEDASDNINADRFFIRNIENYEPGRYEVVFSVDDEGFIETKGDYYGRGHVYLFAYEGDGNSGTAYIQARDRSDTSNIDLQFRTKVGASNSNVMRLTSAGLVGIGTTTPSEALEVNGNVLADNVTVPSDKRFKQDIEAIDHALEKTLQLEGVQFSWRDDEYPDRRFDEDRHIGFIAQDVQEVIPEVVNEAEDGKLSLSYQQIIPVLVEAIKEQQAEIESLREEMAEMKAAQL